MGSQNVTNFAKVHMLRARKAFKPYAVKEPTAEETWTAVSTAVGPLTKSHPFVKAVSSKGYETALNLLLSFAEDLGKAGNKKEIEAVLREHNVDPQLQKPLLRLTSQMTKSLTDQLTSKQEESDAGTAAKDAVTKTLIDVLALRLPPNKVGSASPKQLSNAFQELDRKTLAGIFFKNVLSSLTMLYLDATKVPRPVQEKIKPALLDESGLPAALSREVVELAGNNPEKIRTKVDKRAERAKSGKPVFQPKFDPERIKKPKT